MRAARKEWAREGLRAGVATSQRVCRVCGEPIRLGEPLLGFTWREEFGVSHPTCGYFTPKADTWADREAVAAMRRIIEIGDGPVPAPVADAALARGLVRRVHSAGTRGVQLHTTPVGAALYRLLTASKSASVRGAPSPNPLTGARTDVDSGAETSGGRR